MIEAVCMYLWKFSSEIHSHVQLLYINNCSKAIFKKSKEYHVINSHIKMVT